MCKPQDVGISSSQSITTYALAPIKCTPNGQHLLYASDIVTRALCMTALSFNLGDTIKYIILSSLCQLPDILKKAPISQDSQLTRRPERTLAQYLYGMMAIPPFSLDFVTFLNLFSIFSFWKEPHMIEAGDQPQTPVWVRFVFAPRAH